MRSFIYLMPLLGSIAGTLELLWTAIAATTAPQQAAGYAMACALAVVPYVFSRAIDLARDENESHQNRQSTALEKLASRLAPDQR